MLVKCHLISVSLGQETASFFHKRLMSKYYQAGLCIYESTLHCKMKADTDNKSKNGQGCGPSAMLFTTADGWPELTSEPQRANPCLRCTSFYFILCSCELLLSCVHFLYRLLIFFSVPFVDALYN